jgi:hypothetical protein
MIVRDRGFGVRLRTALAGAGFALLIGAALPGSAALEAQDTRLPLQPRSSMQRVVAPFMEGWYANEDGTYTISFGYRNLNSETVEIPLGESNSIDPAQFHGMQPTTFLPGRHRGVFAVTVPADLARDDVWWSILNASGEVTKVPGRTTVGAYQLDWVPRPHGTVHPRVSFGGDEGRGPPGIMADEMLSATVGAPITISLNARDTSERDPDDHRFDEAIPLRVRWFRHQGPVGGEVEFSRHESTPVPDPPEAGSGRALSAAAIEAAQAARRRTVGLPEGHGAASIVVTFSAPGEYLLRAQVDIFGAPDSSSGDQCCWTNGYVRVSVR